MSLLPPQLSDNYRSLPGTPYGMEPRTLTGRDMDEVIQHARMGLEGDYFSSSARFPTTATMRSRSPYGGSYEQDPYSNGAQVEMGLNDLLRRNNLAVTLANNNINYRAQYSQVHPKMCTDGRYPQDFQLPKTVEEVKVLDGSQLDRILQAYRLPLDLRASSTRSPERKSSEKQQSLEEKTDSPIQPLPDFDWQTTEPLQIRPFKPRYHLTMGLETITASELIVMDNNYLKRVTLRQKIMAEHSETVLGASDSVKPAVDEFYTWMMGTYLPQRYPTMFKLSTATTTVAHPALFNTITRTTYPTHPPTSALTALRNLGSFLDEDILFLLPSPDGDGYCLQGFVTCFPSGFDTSKKLGMKLREIHKPVPGYRERLEGSMDRYFGRLGVGRFVKRVNWSITTNDHLFSAFGNHLYEGEEEEEEVIDIDNTFLRCERQTLHRLPTTHALLFAFKTYQTPLAQIKEEGLGEELAMAIEGLRGGSVPGMWVYKRGVVWGESVKEYLRGG
ncbi:MAG: hypothetical protein M1827_002747 [Pycnora praestabilis]|nr:MAG: hypothetical protein M1827_002747 [Pycnora praestabilis]